MALLAQGREMGIMFDQRWRGRGWLSGEQRRNIKRVRGRLADIVIVADDVRIVCVGRNLLGA